MSLKLNLDAIAKIEEEMAQPKVSYGNILVVDDEAENLYALEQILKEQFTVFSTTKPEEALEISQRERIDVILTDQRMPNMLGTEFLKHVKQENDDNVRMILTGYTDVKDLVECINSGLIYRYLVKPWAAEEILLVVKQAMQVIARKRAVDRMLPHQVVERLYPNGMQDVEEGFGKEVECAIMFLDLRGFTSIAESMETLDAFKLLNSFVKAVGPIMSSHHGFIDKYMGDGILAIFDRDDVFPNDVLECALAIQDKVKEYNATHRSTPVPESRAGQPARKPLECGIGISYGKVVLGTLGYRERIDFTVLGDAVNTASRIENLTKAVKAKILAHSSIIERSTMANLVTRSLGAVALRGKVNDTPLVEILNPATSDEQSAKQASAADLKEGIAHFNAGRLDEALEVLEKAATLSPSDGAVTHFIECVKSKRSPQDYSRDTDWP